MKKQKGLNFEFLDKFQNKLDEETEAISFQLNEKLVSIGDIIKQETGIRPISSEFISWYLENHYSKKKRRLPVKLSNELILQYCFEYKKDLEIKCRKYKPRPDYNLELKNKVFNTLNYALEKDEKLSSENFSALMSEIIYILQNHDLPTEFNILETYEVGLKNESLRYCFYQIYKLDKRTETRKLLVHFLHLKFKSFNKLEFNPDNISECSTYKKFSTKPLYYPE